MSGFLLDTNIVSELVKRKPEPKVTTWIESTDENLLLLSVLTLGEIRKGIASLRDASRRVVLEASRGHERSALRENTGQHITGTPTDRDNAVEPPGWER